MRLVVDLIVLILWFLIKIGDLVLFAALVVVKKLQKLEKSFFRKLRHFNFRFSLPKRRKRVKPQKKIKLVSIFPGPIPHFVKFKYFMFGSIFSFLLIYVPLLFLIFLQ